MDKMNHKIVAGLALIVLVVSGCSTTRDGLLYRAFHNTHAKYNGFFYAKEAMAEAEVGDRGARIAGQQLVGLVDGLVEPVHVVEADGHG